MHSYTKKQQENKTQTAADNTIGRSDANNKRGVYFADNRLASPMQRKLQEGMKSGLQVNQSKVYQLMAGKYASQMPQRKDFSPEVSQRRAMENAILPVRNLSTQGVIQLAIKPVNTSGLPENDRIQSLIRAYNTNYEQATLDELVALANAFKPTNERQKVSVLNLIDQLDIEAGNRHVVTGRVNVPRDVSDSDDATKEKNCALTSVGALLGCKASAIHKKLGGNGAEQESDIFRKNERHGQIGGDALSGQINGMVIYVAKAFEQMGFSVTITGERSEYDLIPAEQGLAAMKAYPTGTKFLVYLSKTRPLTQVDETGELLSEAGEGGTEQVGSHWVFADRYGSQVFFYDYQVGRVQAEIRRQGSRELRTGGGASSPVRGHEGSPTAFGGKSGFDESAFLAAFSRKGIKKSPDSSDDESGALHDSPTNAFGKPGTKNDHDSSSDDESGGFNGALAKALGKFATKNTYDSSDDELEPFGTAFGQTSKRKGIGHSSDDEPEPFGTAFDNALKNREVDFFDDESELASGSRPVGSETVEIIPEATFDARIPLYKSSTVTFSDYNEMFFVAVIPHIANRKILQQKMKELQ